MFFMFFMFFILAKIIKNNKKQLTRKKLAFLCAQKTQNHRQMIIGDEPIDWTCADVKELCFDVLFFEMKKTRHSNPVKHGCRSVMAENGAKLSFFMFFYRFFIVFYVFYVFYFEKWSNRATL